MSKRSKLVKVLIKEWQGHAKGDILSVSNATAARLIAEKAVSLYDPNAKKKTVPVKDSEAKK